MAPNMFFISLLVFERGKILLFFLVHLTVACLTGALLKIVREDIYSVLPYFCALHGQLASSLVPSASSPQPACMYVHDSNGRVFTRRLSPYLLVHSGCLAEHSRVQERRRETGINIFRAESYTPEVLASNPLFL